MKAVDPRGYVCSVCGSDETSIETSSSGYQFFHWYTKDDKRVCKICYVRLNNQKKRVGKLDGRKISKIPTTRYCKNCGATESKERGIKRSNRTHWHKIENGYLCKLCYGTLVSVPQRNGCYILFKGKLITLDYSPRVNYCNLCEVFYDRTNLHHFFYDESKPLDNTFEVCPSCHGTIHAMPVIDLEESENV